jgi:hypothetical protein
MTYLRNAPGESPVVKGFRLGGAANLTISGFDIDLRGDNATNGVQLSEAAHNIVVENNLIRGGASGIKFYGRPHTSGWSYATIVRDNDISGSFYDGVQFDGGRDVTVEHNYIHDVQNNGQHNDGIQAFAADNIRLLRNTIRFENFNGETGPNQCMMLGHGGIPSSLSRLTNVVVAGNICNHWPGQGINVAGVDGLKIVNNTAVDNGTGFNQAGITFADRGDPANYGSTGVEIWNNISNSLFAYSGFAPTLCSHNLVYPNASYSACATNLSTANPLFVDRLDYLLSQTSPARNSGISRPDTPLTDVDGQPYGVPERGARSG